VDALNARFVRGHPSSSLDEAGVLLHGFDHTENQKERWRGCSARAHPDGGGDCEQFGNRFSASIIFRGMLTAGGGAAAQIPLFGSAGGIIFSPPATKIICAYTADGGSRGKRDGCGDDFCDSARSAHDPWCDGRPHLPRDLSNVLRGYVEQKRTSYNEIIVDTAALADYLPDSIEAIFYVASGGRQEEEDARQVHRQFHAAFPALGVDSVPLVRLDLHDTSNPFSL